MAASAVGGTAYIFVDGRSIRLVGECSYALSGSSREPQNGMDGVHGYTEKPMHGFIKFKSRNAKDVDIGALQDATGVTVQVQLNSGKTVIGREMWRNGEQLQPSAEDGSFDIEFASADVAEV